MINRSFCDDSCLGVLTLSVKRAHATETELGPRGVSLGFPLKTQKHVKYEYTVASSGRSNCPGH